MPKSRSLSGQHFFFMMSVASRHRYLRMNAITPQRAANFFVRDRELGSDYFQQGSFDDRKWSAERTREVVVERICALKGFLSCRIA